MTWVAPLLEAQRRGLMNEVEVWETVFGCWSHEDPGQVVHVVLRGWAAVTGAAEPEAVLVDPPDPDGEAIVVLD